MLNWQSLPSAAVDRPLGFSRAGETLCFRLWAPLASKVELLLEARPLAALREDLRSWQPRRSYPLTRSDDGCFSLTLPAAATRDELGAGPEDFLLYRYRLTEADGRVHEAIDPYAQASTVNGRVSVALLAQEVLASQADFAARAALPDLRPGEEAILECHVRDLSIDPLAGLAHPGRFLALCDPETTQVDGFPTGLNYLRQTGISHVQFQPLMDFQTVDEAADLSYNAQYNWGYDPQQYFVPEGSYASDPFDPTSRIRDCRAMIDACHRAGLRVILDVVFNHVYDLGSHGLGQVFADYYFRKNADGSWANGSWCGNETASERPMMRRLMLDALRFWLEVYDVDGFRFDLMGLHDVATMQAIRAMCDSVRPGVLLLGEGWTMGLHSPENPGADQAAAPLLPGIAFFNDACRDALKGDNFSASSTAFVQGAGDGELPWQLFNHLSGGRFVRPYVNAGQNVLYAEAHDNLTLYDKLYLSLPGASTAELHASARLAMAMLGLGFGLPFFQVGMAFFRSKGGDENSYASPDEVNAIDWSTERLEGSFFRDLLRVRRSLRCFACRDHEDLAQRLEGLYFAPDCLVFRYRDEAEDLLFAFHAGRQAETLSINLKKPPHSASHAPSAAAQGDTAGGQAEATVSAASAEPEKLLATALSGPPARLQKTAAGTWQLQLPPVSATLWRL